MSSNTTYKFKKCCISQQCCNYNGHPRMAARRYFTYWQADLPSNEIIEIKEGTDRIDIRFNYKTTLFL